MDEAQDQFEWPWGDAISTNLSDKDLDALLSKHGAASAQCVRTLYAALRSTRRQLRRAKQQIGAYRTLADLSSLQMSSDSMMARMVQSAKKLVHSDRMSLFTVEHRGPNEGVSGSLSGAGGSTAQGRYLLCHIADGDFEGTHLDWGEGIVGSAANENKTISISDAYKDKRFADVYDRKSGYKTRAILTVPITTKDKQVVGVLQAVNKCRSDDGKAGDAAPGDAKSGDSVGSGGGGGGSFTEDDTVILETIAHNAGQMISEKQTLEVLQMEQKRGKLLMSLMNLFNEARDGALPLLNAMKRVVRLLLQICNVEVAKLYIVDACSRELMDIEDCSKQGLDARSIPAWVARHCKVLQSRDPSAALVEERFARDAAKRGLETFLCVPVRSNDGKSAIAVIEVGNKITQGDAKQVGMAHLLSDERRNSVMARSMSKDGEAPDSAGAASLVKFNNEDQRTIELICGQIRALLLLYVDAGAMRLHLPHDHIMRSLVQMHTEVGARPHFPLRTPSSMSLYSLERVVPRTRVDLDDMRLDVFKYNEDELVAFALEIFLMCGVTQEKGYDRETLQNFLVTVRSRYLDNPFHNFHHAFSVLHCTYLLLKQRRGVCPLGHSVTTYMLVAAVCHDLGHPGNTNDFEINSMSQLATKYNQQSVLENFHCSVTLQILRDPKCNIFKSLDRAGVLKMKTVVISLILATDMKHHFSMQSKLRSCSFDKAAVDEKQAAQRRQLFMKMIIHSSDLSNQGLPWSLARVWAGRVCDEFSAQSRKEAKFELPVTPFMKGLETTGGRAKLQVSFIDAILRPWWSVVRNALPGPLTESICANVFKNRQRYARIDGAEHRPLARVEAPIVEDIPPSPAVGRRGGGSRSRRNVLKMPPERKSVAEEGQSVQKKDGAASA